LLKLPPVERVVSAFLRGWVVRETIRFAGNEICGRRVLRRYRLRGSGVVVHVRHSSPDVLNLDEIFYQRLYEAPEPVRGAIAELSDPPRIVDLGANVGLAGAWFLGTYPGASVVAYEPDPANAAVHAETVAANGLDGRWRLVVAAAGANVGLVPFVPGHFAESHLAAPGEDGVQVEAVDVLPELMKADLLKIDVEGAEWAILADERFRDGSAAAVVLEYHPHLCPDPDPRALAERLLRSAGYEVQDIFHAPDGHGMIWGWRR
jgi:FkbM family methyltransferase